MTMRHIDLCSGIGGFALAAHWAGYQTEVFCERDEFCRKVLAKHWPRVPVIDDINNFDGRAYAGADLLTGGIPCQPYSCAGKQLGDDDDRALWPQMLRVITEARPHWVVVENVAGFLNMALDGVLADLEAEGYDCGTVVLPACAVNAPHRRDRVWIVALGVGHGNTNRQECSRWDRSYNFCEAMADSSQFAKREPTNQTDAITTGGKAWDESGNGGEAVSYTDRNNGKGFVGSGNDSQIGEEQGKRQTGFSHRKECDGWSVITGLGGMADGLPGRLDGHFDCEPDIPRVAKGIPNRTARLKALGNAIVPQVAYRLFQAIVMADRGISESIHG